MIAAIILAAGESRRMGTPKALLQFRGETFLDRLIGKLGAQCDPVIVILGHGAETLRAGVHRQAQFVVNADYARGMLTSLQCGLRAVPADGRPVVFTLVDHPNPADATIRTVAQTDQKADVVIPRFEGRKGHPVRLSRRVMDELLSLPASAKPTDVLYRHLDGTHFLDLDDPGIVDDIDDPGAYRELLARVGSL